MATESSIFKKKKEKKVTNDSLTEYKDSSTLRVLFEITGVNVKLLNKVFANTSVASTKQHIFSRRKLPGSTEQYQ